MGREGQEFACDLQCARWTWNEDESPFLPSKQWTCLHWWPQSYWRNRKQAPIKDPFMARKFVIDILILSIWGRKVSTFPSSRFKLISHSGQPYRSSFKGSKAWISSRSEQKTGWDAIWSRISHWSNEWWRSFGYLGSLFYVSWALYNRVCQEKQPRSGSGDRKYCQKLPGLDKSSKEGSKKLR